MDIKEPLQTIKINPDDRYIFFVSVPDKSAEEAEEIGRRARNLLEEWFNSNRQCSVITLYDNISVKVERIENDSNN